jgi:hypothetical protein
MARYPDNYDLGGEVFVCLEHGAREPILIAEAEHLVERLRQGWKLPAYARLDLENCERILAEAKAPAATPISTRAAR